MVANIVGVLQDQRGECRPKVRTTLFSLLSYLPIWWTVWQLVRERSGECHHADLKSEPPCFLMLNSYQLVEVRWREYHHAPLKSEHPCFSSWLLSDLIKCASRTLNWRRKKYSRCQAAKHTHIKVIYLEFLLYWTNLFSPRPIWQTVWHWTDKLIEYAKQATFKHFEFLCICRTLRLSSFFLSSLFSPLTDRKSYLIRKQ